MSFPCSDGNASREAIFSNPDVDYKGRPAGTVDNDCAREISRIMVRGNCGVVIVSPPFRLKICCVSDSLIVFVFLVGAMDYSHEPRSVAPLGRSTAPIFAKRPIPHASIAQDTLFCAHNTQLWYP